MRHPLPALLPVVVLVVIGTPGPATDAGAQPAAAPAAGAERNKPMKPFVVLFRQGPFDLNPGQQKKRFEETRDWVRRYNAAGIQFEPRILGEPSRRAGPTQPGAPAADPAWPVTATLFVEAPDFEQAVRAAEDHPARRYGASVEVRPWSPPPSPPPEGDAVTLPVRHVTVSIDRPPAEVYAFAGDPRNLPRWAAGLAGGAVRKAGDDWVADSPMGKVKVRFAEANTLGVLDHDVTLPSGEVVHNPMRVVPNGRGSEITFTLFRRPGVSDEEFRNDAGRVEQDLGQLKRLLER